MKVWNFKGGGDISFGDNYDVFVGFDKCDYIVDGVLVCEFGVFGEFVGDGEG